MSDKLQFLSKTGDEKSGYRFTVSILGDDPTQLHIALEGYLDNNNSGYFAAAFKKTIDDYNKAKTVVLDLAKLNYISSTGIGSFVEILSYFKKNNYRLFIYRISDKVSSVFDLLGFTAYFQFIKDLTAIPV